MADQISELQPGDLITAELLNAIIRKLQGVGGPSGTVDVPLLFGLTLGAARSILATPGSNLQLGTVLDTAGTVIAPTDPAKATLKVLGQVPSPGVRVLAGTAVSLVIPGSGGTTPGGGQPTVSSFFPTTQAVGQPLQIIGTNFDLTPSKNTVTFNGISGGTPTNSSNAANLFINQVPVGADGAPQPCVIDVTTPTGTARGSLIITPATGVQLATIARINGSTGPQITVSANTDITITGTNFGTTESQVRLILGTPGAGGVPMLTVNAGTLTPTSMTVHLPVLGNIPPAFRSSQPVVQVAGTNGIASPITLNIA